MERLEAPAVPVQERQLVTRDVGPQGVRVAARPEAQDPLGERDQPRVALHVALLAQEVAERVAALVDLVEPRRGLAQTALRPDLPEVDREDPQELLDLEIHRLDLAPEERRDVALEDVGVGHEHAADAQVDHERRDEPPGEGGVGSR